MSSDAGNKKCFVCDLRTRIEEIVVENDLFFAFYDKRPLREGHTIIAPKRHVASFFDLDSRERASLFGFIDKVKELLDKKHKPDGYNLSINNGQAAGAFFDHICIDVVPRKQGDVEFPMASGTRAILGKYLAPFEPPLEYSFIKNKLSKEALARMEYLGEKDPNKKFYLGLKALIRDSEGKILTLVPVDTKVRKHLYFGKMDLPGGRCEQRDKEELNAVQREVYEETNLEIVNITYFDNFIFWDVNLGNDEEPVGLILFLYLAQLPAGKKIELKKSEHIDYEWYWPHEVADLFTQYPMRIREKIRSLEYR